VVDFAPVAPAVGVCVADAVAPAPPGAVALAALSERATSPPDAVAAAVSFFPLRPPHAVNPTSVAHAAAAAISRHLLSIRPPPSATSQPAAHTV